MQHEPHPSPCILQVHQEIPGLLADPGFDRVRGGAEGPDAAGAVLDGGKDVDLGAVEQVSGEEIQRQDPLRLRPQELRPARPIPARRRVDAGILEDLPDGRRRHCDAQPCELAVDPPVPP
jgi:hypothetical protein